MKQIKNIRNFLLISLIAGGTWIGCDDANYSTLDTHVFFEEDVRVQCTIIRIVTADPCTACDKRYQQEVSYVFNLFHSELIFN